MVVFESCQEEVARRDGSWSGFKGGWDWSQLIICSDRDKGPHSAAIAKDPCHVVLGSSGKIN